VRPRVIHSRLIERPDPRVSPKTAAVIFDAFFEVHVAFFAKTRASINHPRKQARKKLSSTRTQPHTYLLPSHRTTRKVSPAIHPKKSSSINKFLIKEARCFFLTRFARKALIKNVTRDRSMTRTLESLLTWTKMNHHTQIVINWRFETIQGFEVDLRPRFLTMLYNQSSLKLRRERLRKSKSVNGAWPIFYAEERTEMWKYERGNVESRWFRGESFRECSPKIPSLATYVNEELIKWSKPMKKWNKL